MTTKAADLAHRLRPLVFRLYYLVRRETPQVQLTLTQGSVLSELLNGGPRRMSALAELERVRMPTMTDVVRRLERLGLLSRRPDPADGRAVLVEVTEVGQRFHRQLVVAREEFLRERLIELDESDRAAIEAALPALTRLLQEDKKKEELIRDER
ncbi:MarR family winged helix-turn-helix transcriptional regulator [Amycolatopsis regifaucium]|uniref:MarR family transcriptional regulator n=1 Tax=Amycolatopsis regifaucium TaxID=546365 RepID=A0A154MKS4_9PSEU|nr:MarR family transcriptional regulator [Amycolatopsis regifaucium]KZB84968.1 MarR family transcriptional regulator [Amycolatopsis regifaucium]OKA03986.1 MarR family transcriptional regulator [Amycolatopsis regifaucium]SFH98747.1 DNA-binding transcriptional regulator, MarR family [Amycolatopsis regifaucium]